MITAQSTLSPLVNAKGKVVAHILVDYSSAVEGSREALVPFLRFSDGIVRQKVFHTPQERFTAELTPAATIKYLHKVIHPKTTLIGWG